MLVARDKIKTNIGEYLLYMFQIEDLIRACKFDKAIIESKLVAQYKTDKDTIEEIRQWYFGLADLMAEEKLATSGHLNAISHKIEELTDFHAYLMQHNDYMAYQTNFNAIKPFIEELKAKNSAIENDIQQMLHAVYGLYILKLGGTEIAKETWDTARKFSVFMAELSKYFKNYEEGKISYE